MAEILVDMRSITKRFPGILANDAIDFQVERGEIHALLGENGAGKSTLMSVLSGFYRPDAGEIWLRGRKASLHSPRQALDHGIGMVHQHFRLVETFTVVENVLLGTTGGPQLFLNRRKYEGTIAGFAKNYGIDIDPRAKIWQLSVGEKQRIEILKLLYRGADILILDEPTAVLTPQDVRDLFKTLRQMTDSGQAIILITHKLQEVMEVADRITVLRKGRNAGTVFKKDVDERMLTGMMVERDLLTVTPPRQHRIGAPVLRLKNASVIGDRGLIALKGVSLEVRSGEILGVAGITGNGQRELAEAITGLRPLTRGKLLIGNADLTNQGPGRLIRAGVGSIPEDRLGTGLVPGLDIYDNVILKDYRRDPISRRQIIDRHAVSDRANRLVSKFQIQTSDLNYPVRLMSGGNLQRLLLAREISLQPKLVIASYPVRGLDVGATESVYRLLTDLCNKGVAILLISEDLDELLSLADRIAVLFRGEIMGIVDAKEADIEDLGLMMVGVLKEPAGA